MPLISKRAESIVVSPIRRIVSLLAQAKNRNSIISFGGGAPSLSPPKEVVDAMINALNENPQKATSYGATRGDEETINAIVNDLKSYKVELNSKEVIMTDGATEGIILTVLSLVNRGDEVLTSDPTYVGFQTPVEIANGKLIRIPTSWENDFQPDMEEVKKKISKKTKAVILLSPDNPTGRVLKEEIVKEFVDLAEDHDFWIIFDDTYRDIYYEGKYLPIFNIKNARERTVVVFTLSKSCSIPGLRIGYSYGNENIIKAMEKVKQFFTLCSSTLSQIAVKTFYSGNVKERYLKEKVLPTYSHRKEVMGECLKQYLPKAGYSIPKGAFYYFVDLSKYLKKLNMDDEEFATRLLTEKEVVVIPGKYFGKKGKLHVRMTFVSENDERIKEGIKKMGEFLSSANAIKENFVNYDFKEETTKIAISEKSLTE